MSHVEKLDLRFLQNKTETFLVSVTHLILRFTIVQNKFQQANKQKINHINDNHINFEVSLHFLGIWPTVRHSGGGIRHEKRQLHHWIAAELSILVMITKQ